MRIAMFVSNYNLGASMAIINTCLSLAERGVYIDLFSYNNTHEDYINFKDKHISLYLFSTKPGNAPLKLVDIIKSLIKGILPDKGIKYLLNWLQRYKLKRDGVYAFTPHAVIKKAEEVLSKNTYTAYIGVEPSGLIWAGLMGGGDRVPVIYLSLELCLEDDPRYRSRYYEILCRYEREVHQRAVATVIQDEERAKLLAKQNNVPLPAFIVMPIAMKGDPVMNKETFLHERLGIPKGKKILLGIGGISRERLSLETAKASVNIPDDWVMVLHGWCWYGDTAYFSKIEELSGSKKLYLSTEMLPFDQLVRVVSSAHVGLTFYNDMGDNERLTGAASGKMAHYFQCGLPVIANDFESIRKIIDIYQCGVCIPSPYYIPEALNKIIGCYEEMRQNAFRCYRDKYEISPHFEKVFNFLKAL